LTTTEKGSTIRPTPNLHACPNLGERIHAALAVHDPSGTYSQHAGVTMTSIFENTSSPVTIHLLHDETLTQDNREKFIRTAQKYSQEINFIDITEQAEKISERIKKVSEKWTIGTLYRMFIPQVLTNIKKVIYLDCDVIVNLDIRELWNIDLENKSIVGAIDMAAYKIDRISPNRKLQMKLCGIDIKRYINAGVTVMNLEKFRVLGDFCDISIKWLSKHSHLPIFPDQDALNSIFIDDIKIIDSKFNVYDLSQNLSNSIIHMWAGKPWKKFTGAKHEKLYWHMYLKSAWGENCTIDDMIDKLSVLGVLSSNSEYFHKHGSQCLKRLLHVIPNRFKNALESLKLKYYWVKYKFSR